MRKLVVKESGTKKEKILLVSLFIAIVIIGWFLFGLKNESTVEGQIISERKWPFDKEAVLDYFFYRLSKDCENQQQIPDLRILDSNGYYSYGWIMYQRETFDSMGEKYGLPHDDIYSWDEQRAIFGAMLKDRELNWKHWLNCAPKVGLDTLKLD